MVAEFATGDAKGKAAQSACVAYVEANKIAEKDLVVNHPVRLAMALNSSVFHPEVLQNPDDCDGLVCINKHRLNIAGGVDVGKDDLDEGENPDESSEMARVAVEDAITELDDKINEIPMVQTVQKTIEIPQLQCIDKVDVPVVQVVQVPQVQVVEQTVEIHHLQTVEKNFEIPQIQMVQGTQTSESLGTAPVRQLPQAEIVEAAEIGAPLPAESGPPFVR